MLSCEQTGVGCERGKIAGAKMNLPDTPVRGGCGAAPAYIASARKVRATAEERFSIPSLA